MLSIHILDHVETLLLTSIWHQAVIGIHIEKGMLSFFLFVHQKNCI